MNLLPTVVSLARASLSRTLRSPTVRHVIHRRLASQPWPPGPPRPAPRKSTSGSGYSHFRSTASPPSPYLPYFLAASGVAISAYVYINLNHAPFTGRVRIMGISRKRELDLGRHTYDDLVHSMSPAILPSRHPEAKRVRAIVRRLAATVKKIDPSLSDGFEWAVVVADVPEPNALCAPGGKILITTGILNILPTEDHVAIVLAHEIAHALNRHGAESMHLQRMLIPIIILLNDIFDSRWLGSLVVQLLMALPYSRRLELEADHVGLILSTEACFDPRVAPDVFSSLAAVQGERPETGVGKLKPFFSTHPQSTDRAQRLNRMLPERVAKYESSCVVPRRFVEQYAYPPPQPFPENW